MEKVLERLAERFSPTVIAHKIADFLPHLMTAIFVFLAFFIVWKVLDRAFSALRDRTHVEPTIAVFIRTSIKYVLLTVGALTALSEIGINVASIVASLGIAGLTIGFAARDTLSNLISGIFIFWDRPFVVDDLIEVQGMYGRVDTITLRSTRVVTVDGRMLAIPNATIINSVVASYTNFPHVRLDVDATIGVEENIERVRREFMQLVNEIGEEAGYMDTPPPQMVVTALNDYNIAVQFRVWLADEKRHVAARFALREGLFERLRAAKVEMPFETIQMAPMKITTAAESTAAA